MTSQFTDMTSSQIFFDVIFFLLSNLVTDLSFMSISSLVLELWQFSFIRDWPEIRKSEIPPLSFSQYLETGRVRGTKFDTNFSNECYWILQNARVTAFTVSELIRGKQQGVAKITAPSPSHTHTQIRVSVFLFIYSMQWEIKIQTENIYDQKKTKTSSKEYVT